MIFQYIDIPHSAYPSIGWWRSGFYHILAVVNKAAVNTYFRVGARFFRHLNLSPGCAPDQMNGPAMTRVSSAPQHCFLHSVLFQGDSFTFLAALPASKILPTWTLHSHWHQVYFSCHWTSWYELHAQVPWLRHCHQRCRLLILPPQLHSLLCFVLAAGWKPVSSHSLLLPSSNLYPIGVTLHISLPSYAHLFIHPADVIEFLLKGSGTVIGIGDIKKWTGKDLWPWGTHISDLSTAGAEVGLERVNRHVNRQ